VTASARILRWHYLAAAALTAHCAATSARTGAWWYAIGLFITGLLLLVAYAREIVAATDHRAAAARAERIARLRMPRPAEGPAPGTLSGPCCERWWTSVGASHVCPKNDHRSSA
jgi:hypothetical protein